MDENQQKVRRVTVEIPEKAWEVAAKFVPEGATPDERLPPLIAAGSFM